MAIGSVVLQSKKHVDKVIVVDDGSHDRTSEVARLAGAEVIRLEKNHGKAEAVRKGFEAIRGNRFSAVVLLDGDGQHDPDEIGSVVQPVLNSEADLVIGSRFMGNEYKIPKYRVFGQKILNGFTNFGSRQRITDSQSGFRALSQKGLQNLDFKSSGYGIESEMIIHFASRGLRIKEVPIGVSYDVPNKHKKNAISMGFGNLNDLISLVSLKRPLLFLGVPGFIFGIFGLLLGFACLNHYYLMGWSWLFQSIFAGFSLMLGVALMVSALTLNSLAHIIGSNHICLPDHVQSHMKEKNDPGQYVGGSRLDDNDSLLRRRNGV